MKSKMLKCVISGCFLCCLLSSACSQSSSTQSTCPTPRPGGIVDMNGCDITDAFVAYMNCLNSNEHSINASFCDYLVGDSWFPTSTTTPTPTATVTHQPTVTPTAATPPVGSVIVSIDSPQTVIKSTGRYFHALVKITSVSNFDIAQYDITYDPDVIKVQDVTAGDISGTTIPIEEWGFVPASTQGTVRIVNSVPHSPGVSGEGYLADIYFKVMGDLGDSSVISFVGSLMIGNNVGIEFSAVWTDGSVTIE